MNFVIKKHIFLIFPLIIFVYLLNFYIDNFFISSFFALLMLEIIFRFILFLIYGKNYTNLFFPYALTNLEKAAVLPMASPSGDLCVVINIFSALSSSDLKASIMR